MQETHTRPKAPPRKPKPACCDPSCESGLRNNYFVGKKLSPDALELEQRYLIERRRLLNRAIHGWGLVYGYPVEIVEPGRCRGQHPGLGIGGGLLLDPCGRELLQVSPTLVEFDDLIILPPPKSAPAAEGRPGQREEAGRERVGCFLLSAHYAEQAFGPVEICSCARKEWDHTCETVRYSLRPIDCKDCCRGFPCELECECASGPCCDDEQAARFGVREQAESRPRGAHARGVCRCLCNHRIGLELPDDCDDKLCERQERCGTVRVDLRHPVPLACISAHYQEHSYTPALEVEPCGPRRLVKRNDLLFDLIRGCDLTRIAEVGWSDWHRRAQSVPFDEFSQALGPAGKDEAEYVTRDFWVRFSGPVRKDSLQPDVFVMRAISPEGEGGWWVTARVPIVRVETRSDPKDPPDHAREARVVVDGGWLEDAVRGRKSIFDDHETRFEIEVRGDYIVDCNGQRVDANADGLYAAPGGNGAPGSTLLSDFVVARKERGSDHAPSRSAFRSEGASS